jgi:parvulin-like peptidyl-prolyl isomerase
MRRGFLALAVVTTMTAACGGGQQELGVATQEARPLAAAAGDPRTADPTAATPAPTNTGTTFKVGKADDPSSTSSAKPGGSDPSPAPATPPKKIAARHVLVQWMNAEKAAPSVVRTKDQALAVAKEVLRRARAGDDLARLAVEYSDEPGAGNRGGSLGVFGHGAMVPAFEEAAFKLKVGEVSDIVETPFGYHVIQRTE